MWRHIVSNFLTLLVVILIGLGTLAAWVKHQYEGPGPLAEAVCVRVAPGAALSTVSEDLAAQGVVSSSYIFRVGADYAGRANALKYGSYLIPEGASMSQVVGVLTDGGPSTCGSELNYRVGVNATRIILRELDPVTGRYVEKAKFDPLSEEVPAEVSSELSKSDLRVRVTLAEGVTSWQVVEALKAAPFLTGNVEEVPDEGTLSPQSYEVTRGSDRAALLAEMEARQSAILAAAWAARADGLPYESPEEALIMASIVEKETGIAEERARVAAVFVNRLRRGMKLQTDPTVIYGVTRGQGVLGRGLRQSELRRETPWNTYVIDGLPQTPIANPGRAAIAAALNPAQTDDLYFVADGTGGHVFATTLAEHNRNVARWREIEAQRQGN
ncbi:endolytic transglycosylase MltG [Phaeovulum vinaykumarii]|uniref:Endolytic murein transglycosylase n=1 Tax=Phaeovulum vinaykumarii TaxID=407234 RepID=A0A1N7L682_9RHOB|nr:endolytic transglycosylase MltG [Phaeovulum vinaykumarii]SIS69348.1 UPF0755 protein [Phaeovulum vinaykumarii]SOB99535.1 UPF0755 protein [Phaeovulum vinaykumarii]